jgi:Tfp pilus assembly PilM family ATPase
MFGLNRKVLGLDIGSSSIKWSVFGTGKKPAIFGLGNVKTPEGAISDGCITDRRALTDELRKIVPIQRPGLSKAYITLSGTKILVRTVCLPSMKAAQLHNAVGYQVEQLIYNLAKGYITDYSIIGPTGRQNQSGITVLIAAVPSDVVDEYVRLVEDLGMKLAVVDLHGNSAGRFLTATYPALYDSCFAIVDLGASSAVVTITDKGRPLLVRTISYSSRCYGQWSGNGPMRYAIDQVYRTVEYYRNNVKQEISKIILIGGRSSIDAIDRDLTAMTGVECTAIGRLPVAGNMAEISNRPVEIFANVLGLAFRGER